jgi:hypothetical protein
VRLFKGGCVGRVVAVVVVEFVMLEAKRRNEPKRFES